MIDLGSSFRSPPLQRSPTSQKIQEALPGMFSKPALDQQNPVQDSFISKFKQNVLHIDIPSIGIGLLDSTRKRSN